MPLHACAQVVSALGNSKGFGLLVQRYAPDILLRDKRILNGSDTLRYIQRPVTFFHEQVILTRENEVDWQS